MSAYDFCPFTHSWQPEVSGGLTLHGVLVNAGSVITDAQAELPFVVSNLDADPLRLRVTEGVAQRFTSDAVCLVTHDRFQPARHAFYFEINDRRFARGRVLREFFCNGSYCVGKIIGFEGRRAQPLYCVTTFRNRLSRLIEGEIKPLLGFLWIVG
jgi:hypothetical protein